MDKHYTLWVKSHCPFCIKAKDALYANKLDHTIHIMDDRLEELDELKEKWNHFTVPLITLEDGKQPELIGGYTDLKKHFGSENDD